MVIFKGSYSAASQAASAPLVSNAGEAAAKWPRADERGA